MTVSLDEQIVCVKREIGLRERLYPRWIKSGMMKLDQANYQIAEMKAVLETLEKLRREDLPIAVSKIGVKDEQNC